MNAAQPAESNAPKPRLVLVDGSGYIFRAYHALPPLTRRDGIAVGAVYGFTQMLLNLRDQYAHDFLAVIFDASRKTFRNEMYADYKAHRPPAPDDLIPQFALVRDATRALGVPAIELDQFEADDLIASYAESARAQGLETVIVSSDKDLMQLVCEGQISMYDPMKKKAIGCAEVKEKFGVDPHLVIEVQALIGDSVDNVPGVPSIGPKTAAELILQFGTVKGVLASLDQIKQPKRREVLTLHAENARLSRQLVELKRDVPLPVPLEALEIKPYDRAEFAAFLDAQSFGALAKRLGFTSDSSSAAPRANPAAARFMQPGEGPAAPVANTAAVPTHYETIADELTLQRWIAEATKVGCVAIDSETTSLDSTNAELVGISLAIAPGRAAYIPIAHVTELASTAKQTSLFDAAPAAGKSLVEGQLTMEKVAEQLQPLFANQGVLKVGHNLKYDLTVLARYGLAPSPIADTMLLSYCISGGLHAHGLDFLAERFFAHKMTSFTDITGTGKNKKIFSEVDLPTATHYGAEDADFTLRLFHALHSQLHTNKVTAVYETIERPLIPVIAKMEAAGIRIDTGVLEELSRQFAGYCGSLEREIIDLAGMPFAIGSPKQLGEVLFDKLQLPGGKKSAKSGAYTTDAYVLEELAEAGYPIARKVVEWRQFSKLKSTYTDSLPKAMAADGRVHTSYSMAATTTGRLSSNEPNLQNIPIRTEEGRRIRHAFIAAPGHQLISADYSQIELRLLAEMADIPVLRDAFRNGIDIHAVTAGQMFNTALADVTGEQRRRAKMINFGIIYGISAHGLSTRLGIDRKEAADYIGRYFEQYPGIREYMDRTIQFAREHSYVETLYGRRVHVKDINSRNGAFRQFSERAAINAPLQGTAADIIKRAMISVDAMLGTRARLLLQVHDELVIEAPQDSAEQIAREVKRAMERVAQLSVPLTVEVGIGLNWGEIH